jgi:hypothetical protein
LKAFNQRIMLGRARLFLVLIKVINTTPTRPNGKSNLQEIDGGVLHETYQNRGVKDFTTVLCCDHRCGRCQICVSNKYIYAPHLCYNDLYIHSLKPGLLSPSVGMTDHDQVRWSRVAELTVITPTENVHNSYKHSDQVGNNKAAIIQNLDVNLLQ